MRVRVQVKLAVVRILTSAAVSGNAHAESQESMMLGKIDYELFKLFQFINQVGHLAFLNTPFSSLFVFFSAHPRIILKLVRLQFPRTHLLTIPASLSVKVIRMYLAKLRTYLGKLQIKKENVHILCPCYGCYGALSELDEALKSW